MKELQLTEKGILVNARDVPLTNLSKNDSVIVGVYAHLYKESSTVNSERDNCNY